MNITSTTEDEELRQIQQEYQNLRSTSKFKEVYNKKQPLVSICVATYNRADLLISRSLKSLLNQTYTNLEIIIVGDACTDDTAKLVASYNDTRIMFENLKQRGPYPRPGRNRWLVAGSNAMNRAMDLATGDFITHLDDDDWANPQRIEILLEQAIKYQAEFIWHDFLVQNNNGTWKTLGSPELKLAQVTTGSIFYHRFFSKIKWDVFAFRVQEPGDWNRIKKIKSLEPKLLYNNQKLLIHYREQQQNHSLDELNEQYLED